VTLYLCGLAREWDALRDISEAIINLMIRKEDERMSKNGRRLVKIIEMNL
jgi:hypothetical protein